MEAVVKEFRNQISELEIFQRIDKEWASQYRADKWRELLRTMDHEGKLLAMAIGGSWRGYQNYRR